MDTTLLRALAVLLIANSHLEPLYPFRPLAADGLIGNSLFFLLSGLGLTLSPRAGQGRFLDWYRRRLSRIVPGLWLTVLIGTVAIGGAWRQWGPLDYARNLIWPTPYGFLTQILLLYPAFYLVKSARSPAVEVGLMGGLSIPYVYINLYDYNLHTLSSIFYFQLMLLGSLLAGRVRGYAGNSRAALWVLALTLPVYVGVRYAMLTGRLPLNTAPLHLLMLPILLGLLRLCATPAARAFARHPWTEPAVSFLAAITLEIYLVHGYVYEHPWVQALPFPVNLAVFWAVTLPLAWLVALASDQVRRTLQILAPARAIPPAGDAVVSPLSASQA